MTEIYDVSGILIIDHRAREWCKLPYIDHPNGCPNYNKSSLCPPKAPLIEDWLNLSEPQWLFVEEFDLSEFARKMKEKHPSWSDRQCRCVLYWQNIPRKILRDEIIEFQKTYPDTIHTLLPEAMGVHVMATARRLGIPIKAKPDGVIFKIALVGYPKLKSGQMKLELSD